MTTSSIRGLTNLGQWVSWDPATASMKVAEGGTWLIEQGIFTEYSSKTYSDPGFLDCRGQLLTPGLIDPHTHPAFATTRELEFEMRAQGKSYQEIAATGGGIRSSVTSLREISEGDLTQRITERFHMMLAHGTTTVECKSGYGLSTESELKSLRAIKAATSQSPIRSYSTFLGAHEVPDEFRSDRSAYLNLIIDEMIPRVVNENLADFCDVFCEEGVFSIEETKKILRAAQTHDLKARFHADEFVSTGGAELAVELGACSADHLMAVSPAGISALANSSTVAILLPGTTFFLGTNTWAPARKMIDAGVTVALATDFNPGSNMSLNLPFVMTLAVIHLKMTPLEALQASTISGAKSLGQSHHLGAIYPGYQADAVVWNLQNYRQIPYFYGSSLVAEVITGGSLLSSPSA